jgi:CHASE2 domain-containing sensor protein
MSEDIAYRQRRYLIMMGIRLVCFVIAVVLFTNGAGWLTAIPAVGAIIIPYFAVVFANGGREPTSRRGFQAYHPQLPERHSAPRRNAYQAVAEEPATGPHPPGQNQT